MSSRCPSVLQARMASSESSPAVNTSLVSVSAILLPLALPNEVLPDGSTLIGLVALVPAFLALYRTPSHRVAVWLGALFGALSTAIGNYWLAFFGDFSVWTIGSVVAVYTLFNSILFGYLHFLAHRSAAAGRALVIAVAWTAYELLKSIGFLGYPWGLVAYPLARINAIAQIAELTGVWGLSFLAAYVNASIAELFRSRDTARPPDSKVCSRVAAHFAMVIALILVAGAFGLWRIPLVTPERTLRAVIVQQNVDSWRPGAFEDALRTAQNLTRSALRRARTPVDMIVWSETSLRRPYEESLTFYAERPEGDAFFDFLRETAVPMVVGAPVPVSASDEILYGNGALIIAPTGAVLGRYAKQQLVPVAEGVPFWNVTSIRRFLTDVVGVRGVWTPGRSSRPIPLPLSDGTEVAVGTPICFEDAFGWVGRRMVKNGAELLVNLTNNSWSRQNSAQLQHLVAARLRTIELRTTLVRSSNSGVSTVIDARGIATQALPMFEATSRVIEVPIYEPQRTLYRALGDWVGIVAVATTLLRVVWLAYRNLRRGD